MRRDLPRLVDAVQRNCHIADARHARDMSLCIYLLEMREFYRWEHELPLAAQPPKQALSRWIAEREALWGELEDAGFESLPLGARRVDPFDVAAVNRELLPHGLVYGGGYGRFHKPHFFLGELARQERREDIEVLVTGCEYARDLTGLPAAFQHGTIYLRRESLRRWLWEKFEAWGVRKPGGALGAALDAYGFDSDPEAALERMTDNESETVILHELGEARAEALLGAPWRALLAGLTRRRAELAARAVRDHLADSLSTLPALIARADAAALHFYFANLEGMRKALAPQLEAAYLEWRATGADAALRAAVARGLAHWQAAAQHLIALHAADPQGAQARIEALAADSAPQLAF